MANRKSIERKWIENFKKCPLVDASTGTYKNHYARQLFYGKQDETYSSDYPHNFQEFLNKSKDLNREHAIENLLVFLHFIGIKIRKETINNHLQKFPNDFDKVIKKSRYILETLAHNETVNISNPYFKDNNSDIFFLLRIESEETITVGQLDMFEDMELPELYSRFSDFPNGYENDETIKKLFNRIENSNDCFFITGKAGTGKSTFIHYFARNSKKNVLLTAFTGIASVNIGGQTIHSFFQFPLKPLLPEDDEIKVFGQNSPKYNLIKKIDTIVIDEVSMLRSDILEAIDYSLRINGGDPNKLFGGKQLLFVGDIFQLPPINAEEIEGIQYNELYKSEYFFDSPAYKKSNTIYFEFKVSHRQKDDKPFVELLDKVRVCEVNDETLTALNQRYNSDYTPKQEEFVITLTSTNAIANAENARKLLELPYSSYYFEAEIKGEFNDKRYPTIKTLELKRNAQIIFIKNDAAKRWVNGTIAKVDFITKDFLRVRLQDGSEHNVERVTWENRKYKYDRAKRKIVSEVVGTFHQFPIKLAWAITVHKSQGLTFDNIIIDLGNGAFVNGQVYTALSRCRTLNGITLRRKLRTEDIISDQRIIKFHETEQLLHSIL